MKVDFKILRVDVLSKFIFEKYSHGNFKIFICTFFYDTKFLIKK